MTQAAHLDPIKTAFTAWLKVFALFSATFLFSLWYLNQYYLGDQQFYNRFYYSLVQADPRHWARLQEIHLGSAEPLYRYVIGAAAYYDVDRIVYLSLWNGLLIGSIVYLAIKTRCSLVFAILLLTNYYVFVLLGPAERLKFAYICLVLGFAADNLKLRFALSAISIFFHTQALVQFASSAGYYFISNLRVIFMSPLYLLLLVVFGSVSIGAILYIFFEFVGVSVVLKMDVYSNESEGLLEAIQWGMILLGGLVVFRGRLAYFIGMLPMGVLTILFGNRVNVATLVFFAALVMTQEKTRHPLVLVVMGYMSVKSIPFMLDVVKYGTGY